MVTKRRYKIPVKPSDKLIVFIFPILLTLLNSNWIFTPATDFLPDPWFYLAYFRYFYNYAPFFPSNIHYFVERVTWIVPGYTIYKIFPPLQANYLLHLIVCYIALYSLYGILTALFNQRTAILSTLLMGGYPWFLRAVGWDYVDGIGIALMLLLIYTLTTSRTSLYWKPISFLAGIIHAALIITNLFWVGFALSWFFYFLYINLPIHREKAWKLLGQAIYFILGNLVLTIVMAYYYNSVTGTYNFLHNSLAFSAQKAHSKILIESVLVIYGRMPLYWHVLPIVIAISTLWRIIKSESKEIYSHFTAVALLFISTYGCLIFWHYYTLPYLNIFLYSSFAIPAIFLLLGGLFSNVVIKLSDQLFNFIIALTFVLLSAPFILVVKYPVLENLQGNTLLITVCSLALILTISSFKEGISVLVILTSYSMLSFLLGANSYVFLSESSKGRDNFTAIIEASNTIDAYYTNHKYSDFRLWYREDTNYNTFFDLSAIYLYPWGSTIDHQLSSKKHDPILAFSNSEQLQNNDNIVIISSDLKASDVLTEANRALAYRNSSVKLITIKEIKAGSLHFVLYFTKATVTPSTQ